MSASQGTFNKHSSHIMMHVCEASIADRDNPLRNHSKSLSKDTGDCVGFKGLVFAKAQRASTLLIPLPSCRDTLLLISGVCNQMLCLIQTVSSRSPGLGHHYAICSKFLDRLETGCGHWVCFSLGFYKKGIRLIHELTRKILQEELYNMLLSKICIFPLWAIKTLWRRRGLLGYWYDDPSETSPPERHLLNW